MTPIPSSAHAYPLRARIPETLPEDVLAKMHAPPKPDYPVIAPTDLPKFDAFLFGIPTRYGNFPAQWKVRLFPQGASLAGSSYIPCSRSGIRLAASGLRDPSLASMLESSLPPVHQEEARVRNAHLLTVFTL
jgi:hypothetical protein